MRHPFLTCLRTGARVVLASVYAGRTTALILLGCLSAGVAAAQDDGPFDPTLDCRALTNTGLDPQQIGLPAALAAAEQRRLSLDNLAYTLTWADREPDPTYVPALKRLVEQYRCASGTAGLAMSAIEAAGEPSGYFLSYAQNWRRDDRMAFEAFNALAIRGDTTVAEDLRAVAREAPSFGRFGYRMQDGLRSYQGGVMTWERFRQSTLRKQLELSGLTVLNARGGVVLRGVSGDSLALIEDEQGSYLRVIPRRVLRLLARTYPTAVTETITAYEDTLATRFLANRTPAHRALYLAVAAPQARQVAFPSNGPPLPAVVASAALTPAVCVEAPRDRPGDLTAVFSYTSAEPSAVRIAYGAGNDFSNAPGDVSPEVFFPAAQPDAPGRTFRVALLPDATASWTLLGQTVVAGPATRRCGSTAD